MINNKKDLKIVNSINAYYDSFKELENEKLIELYNSERDLKKLLAVVKIAFERVVNINIYDEQLLAAYYMCKGRIIEMKTGEGKTFVCIIVALIRCKTTKTYVVTINNVLAERDMETGKPLFDFFKKNVGHTELKDVHEFNKRLYLNSDCIYSSVSKLVFDYLSDRDFFKFGSVIIDEVDYILIDNAISQFSLGKENLFFEENYNISFNAYGVAQKRLPELKGKELPFVLKKWSKYYENKEYDYYFIDNYQTSFLTKKGLKKIEGFAEEANETYNDYFVSAFYYMLQAKHLYHKDRDYAVKNSGSKSWIELIDPNNGRSLKNSHKEFELQYAIETKEEVNKISSQMCSETISMQLFFSFFPFLTGMSGTVGYSRNEFKNNFKRRTYEIPTHLPVIRKDIPDKMLSTKEACYKEAVRVVKENIEEPFLIVCENEKEVSVIDNYFKENGLEDIYVFTNNNIEEEKQIIDSYKNKNVKILTTSLFGRGTDIKISEKAKQSKGLIVIIIGKFKNKRIEQQMRGRSGRQGEVGLSYCFYSIEDYFFHSIQERHYKKLLRKIEKAEKEVNPKKQSLIYEELNEYTERLQKHLLALNEGHRYQTLHFDIIIDEFFNKLKEDLNGVSLLKEMKKADFISEQDYDALILKLGKFLNNSISPSILEELLKYISDNIILASKADLYWQICDISNVMNLSTLEDDKRDYLYYFYIIPALKEYKKECLLNIFDKIMTAEITAEKVHDQMIQVNTNKSKTAEFIKKEYLDILRNVEIINQDEN